MFVFSPSGASHLLHICLNYVNTCMLVENISSLLSSRQTHDHVSVLSATAKIITKHLADNNLITKKCKVDDSSVNEDISTIPGHFLTMLSSFAFLQEL